MNEPRFKASADRALAFFKRLRIPDMPGKPTFAEAGRPWQFEFVAELFGGQNPDTKAQSVREAFLCVSKKNYKTGVGAGIILTAAYMQDREDAELLLLAGTRLAAGTAFRTIVGMAKADEELATVYKPNNTTMVLKDTTDGTQIKVISLNNSTAAGSRASFVLVDELWTMGELEKAEGALQEATGGLTSRPEGFACYLTTQSDKPPAGVFKDKLEYARKVKSGEVKDPTFLPVLYELPPGYNWRRNIKRAFELTNPNLGASVDLAYLLSKYEQVKNDRTGKLQIFLSKHLNLEIGMSLRTDNWAGAEYWEQCQVDMTLDELLERSEVVTIGIDGGGLDDLLGFYVMGREIGTGRKLAWGHTWCASIVLERRQEIAPRLRDFESAGELSISPNAPNVQELAEVVAKIRATGKLERVGVDAADMGGIHEALQGAGVEESELIGIKQGWQLGSAISVTERWLANGELAVSRQALPTWAVSNARIEQRSNSILITKQASGKCKIDPVIALFNAASLMALGPPAKGPPKKLVFFSV